MILVTHETNPDDIAGMAKAVGILTQTGGATSHAAVVARAMDKPCVVGCTDLVIDRPDRREGRQADQRRRDDRRRDRQGVGRGRRCR